MHKHFQELVEDTFSWEKPYIIFLSMKVVATFIIVHFNQQVHSINYTDF